ncbi:unnamed protein product [Psylliodes chrysocephalus]|uniref:Uncharacterized protein n=1 Tax=Psylliodes chrysocephalus TaxID=3402493 RepID=A0A9P0GDD1_9CUCU|nr:unnamed protein product [Psylliodes chrysocephala]
MVANKLFALLLLEEEEQEELAIATVKVSNKPVNELFFCRDAEEHSNSYILVMYLVIQFSDECGGGLALIHRKWLTPRKRRVYWPPYKELNTFNKSLKNGEEVNESWSLYGVKRIFYETDDLEKGRRKLKQAENSSDLNSEFDEEAPRKSASKKKIL